MYRDFFEMFGCDESEWFEMQKFYYRDLLKYAFFAKSNADYFEALKWLESNDETFSKSFKVDFEKYL